MGLISLFTEKLFISSVTRANKSLPSDWSNCLFKTDTTFFMEISALVNLCWETRGG